MSSASIGAIYSLFECAIVRICGRSHAYTATATPALDCCSKVTRSSLIAIQEE
ncbi:hypothetical protein [Tolypothrix sp. NIES-4075]|uniref:hypothetical protein n=1 Tax=Tolypothrix sp. NIES-4075 TaxID=2005459 RepID=UPI001F21BB27|nr:hypothetical protein [Tolypothrix sp. NIES-4075]